MTEISVVIDDAAIAVAGADDMKLLSASLCGSPMGMQSLRVTGIGHMDETKVEHLTWVMQQMAVNQILDLHLTESNQYSTPDRSVMRYGTDEIMSRLERMKEKQESDGRVAAPKIVYPDLYYWVQINSDPPVEAFLDGFDQLQAELMWSSHKPKFEFSVMGISVLPDGNTKQKYWLNVTLDLGDRLRIVAKQSPHIQAKVAVNRVA